jgi:phenylacetic acid degradation operon negative regulatory protein
MFGTLVTGVGPIAHRSHRKTAMEGPSGAQSRRRATGCVSPYGPPAAPYPGAVTIAARDRSTAPSDHPGMRPQTLMLTVLGEAVLGRDVAVYSGTFVEVMQRLDVSEEATRSTLTRMVSRDLLARHRRGRKMYFGLTPRAIGVLAEGADRLWDQGAVNRDQQAGWTLLGFSLPESRRDERHQLRSRLRWAGFGPLRSGLWIAPGSVDVAAVLQDTRLLDHVQVFQAEPVGDVARIVSEAFDLTAIAARYGDFLRRWRRPRPLPAAPDDLARQLWLVSDWLLVVRDDPRIPLQHLPTGWPAVAAERVFRRRHAAFRRKAERILAGLLDAIDVPPTR